MKCQILLRKRLGTATFLACAPVLMATAAPVLPSFTVLAPEAMREVVLEGQVEALRQTHMAAQVPGTVQELAVQAGDTVKAGQLLLKIDARSAEQQLAASTAQIAAAKAQLTIATAELARKQQLHARNYIAKAALEQAEGAHQAAQAQLDALSAQAAIAQTQRGFHGLHAPYAGIVAQRLVAQGDMAMPGRPLLLIYDPSAMRVSAQLPRSLLDQAGNMEIRVDIAGQPAQIVPARVQILPLVDAATLSQTVRAELPPGLRGLFPGQFARLHVRLTGQAAAKGNGQITVPQKSLLRRAEMTGVYVLDSNNRPLLRQVRLGRVRGENVEVLAGLQAGERVVSEPHQVSAVLYGAGK